MKPKFRASRFTSLRGGSASKRSHARLTGILACSIVALIGTHSAEAQVTATATTTATGANTWNWVSGANTLSWSTSPSIPGVNGTADSATWTVSTTKSAAQTLNFGQDLTMNQIILKMGSTGSYYLGADLTRRTVTWVANGGTTALLDFQKTAGNALRNKFFANSVLNTDLQVNLRFQASKDSVFGGIVSGAGKLTVDYKQNINDTVAAANAIQIGTPGDLASTHTGGTRLVTSATTGTLTALTWRADKAGAFGTGMLELNKVTLNLNGFNQTVGGLGDGANSSVILNNGGSALTLGLDFASSAGNKSFAGAIKNGTQTIALTKSGTGTQTLTGTNTYTGATAVTAGTLLLGSAGSITSNATVSANAALGGDGAMTGSATFNDTSIFAWNLSITNPANSASANTGDTFAITGALADGGSAGDSVFKILLGGSQTFSDNFWTASHSWANVLTSTSGVSLATLFTSFSYANASNSLTAPTGGSFSFTGSTLNYSAVPEVSNLLAGALLGAGLLRRRRSGSEAKRCA